MVSYLTSLGYVVKIVEDSVGRYWLASTNDFDFFNTHLKNLEWRPKADAQRDLDGIALRLNLSRRNER